MKFSIIIPAYNLEGYISLCLNSILEQNYKDYEIIIVNDGSTDLTENICKQFISKDSRIKYIYQKNRGLSCARNKGIEQAIGEYLLFLDGDDVLLEKSALQEIKDGLNDCEVVVFGWKLVLGEEILQDKKNGINFDIFSNREKLSGKEYLSIVLQQKKLYPWYAVIYAYKRKFWIENEFSFIEGKVYEDVSLVPNILVKAKTISVIPRFLYGYTVSRESAITKAISLKAEMDKIDSIIKNVQLFTNDNIDIKIQKLLLNNVSCLYYSTMILTSALENPLDKEVLLKKLEENKWICMYTTRKPQVYVAWLIKIIGISNTVQLLGVRRKIKKYSVICFEMQSVKEKYTGEI